MKYLLDTNVMVRMLRRVKSESIGTRLRSLSEGEAVTCAIVRAELLAGALRSQSHEKNLAEVAALLSGFGSLAFDDSAADHGASIRDGLERSGLPIGPNDLLIAAIAMANGLILVTHNTREFSRVPGLRIEDWEAA